MAAGYVMLAIGLLVTVGVNVAAFLVMGWPGAGVFCVVFDGWVLWGLRSMRGAQ